jgi:hypothetical protein
MADFLPKPLNFLQNLEFLNYSNAKQTILILVYLRQLHLIDFRLEL